MIMTTQTNKLISILVPTYNLGDNSLLYLEENLSSINSQTYDNIEIVISDNSTDDEVKNFVDNFPFREDIKVSYYRCTRGAGHSGVANTNNAWDKSTGDYIKSLPQDDKFFSDEAVRLIVDTLETHGWCAFKSICQKDAEDSYYSYEGNFPRNSPSYPQDLLKGLNYIGGPASVAWRNTELRLDESLRWLNDVDLYYRFWKTWGPHAIIQSEDPLISIRVRQGALSNEIPVEEKVSEPAFLNQKYKSDTVK